MEIDQTLYVNSGVLALRPNLLTDDLVRSFVAFSDSNPQLIHPDQDFLNYYFKDRIHFLDERFNYQTTIFQYRLVRPLAFYHGKILHYVGQVKPLKGKFSPVLAPGILPFWLHAYETPELGQHLSGTMSYALPLSPTRVGLYPAVWETTD